MFNTTWSELPVTVKENLTKPFVNNTINHSEWLRWLEQEFAKYHGTFVINQTGVECVIIFESEKDYMFFILKWS